VPCYLFTLHAYRSWMPDREEGFVRRKRGILPPDASLARRYENDAKQEQILFDPFIQQTMIEEAQIASQRQRYRVHFIATETTHLHVLLSWPDERPWLKIRNGLKSSLTRRLNKEIQFRRWFVESASRKRVKDQSHFDHLVSQYLPSHRGLKWSEKGGVFR
jgi:REP element-mobilizing transposase RayT